MWEVLWNMPWREGLCSPERIDGEAGAKGVGGHEKWDSVVARIEKELE